MGRYRHILLLKFKEGVNPDETMQVLEKYAKENVIIKYSVEIEDGRDILTPVELRHGYSHIFMLTFKTVEEFNAYRCDPKDIEHSPAYSSAVADVLKFNYESVHVK